MKIRRWTASGFLAAAVTLTIVLLSSFWGIERVSESAEWRSHAHAVLKECSDFRSAVLEMEGGERGYLLTGEDVYLARYERARGMVMTTLARLRELDEAQGAQRARLDAIEGITGERISLFTRAIEAKRIGTPLSGMSQALAAGTERMAALGDALLHFEGAEEARLHERDARLQASLRMMIALVAMATTLALATATLGMRSVRAEAHRRLDAKANELATSSRLAEEQERVRAMLDAIIENLPMTLVLKEPATLTYQRVNRAAEALLHRSREELVGRRDADLFDRETTARMEKSDREALEELRMVDIPEEPVPTVDGEKWVHTRKVPILDADGSVRSLLSLSADITARRAAVEELSRSERRFRAIFEDSGEAILVVDRKNDRVIAANPAACTLFRLSKAEFLTRRRQDIAKLDDDVLHRMSRDQGTGIHDTRVLVRGDGSTFEAEATLSTITGSGMEAQITAIVRDVTERRAYEQKLIEARLAAEAASRELEAFSYSVSHDLRAPLRAIDGFSQALLEDYSSVLDEQGRHYLIRVRAASQRMAQLIDDLLDLSRVTRSQMSLTPVDMSVVAGSILDELRQVDPARDVTVTVDPALKVEGDARLLRIALVNLLGNAWKFTSKTPDARIHFGCELQNDEPVYFVRDNGAGFNPEYTDKLFGAFQRLHAASEFDGTGIGLAIVQRIVQRHGGRAWAVGAPGEGATFYFTLGSIDSPASRS